MLEVEDVSISFGGNKALQNVSFSVARQEIFGLVGPNGAGKTTMFNAIAGAYAVDRGKIVLEGRPIMGMPPSERCRLGIARTFQITQPFSNLTVEENIMVGAALHTRALREMRSVARACAAMVGLDAKIDAPAKSLSTGQRKRLEMARALATRPKLLLLDEVTGGVDQASLPGIIALVARLRQEGVTIVMIEHNMHVLTALTDRILFMSRGEGLVEGASQAVMRDPRVVSLYLGELDA